MRAPTLLITPMSTVPSSSPSAEAGSSPSHLATTLENNQDPPFLSSQKPTAKTTGNNSRNPQNNDDDDPNTPLIDQWGYPIRLPQYGKACLGGMSIFVDGVAVDKKALVEACQDRDKILKLKADIAAKRTALRYGLPSGSAHTRSRLSNDGNGLSNDNDTEDNATQE
ncbi:MAG: hypothetical protein Q9218_004742 [Villophora microphyllina]